MVSIYICICLLYIQVMFRSVWWIRKASWRLKWSGHEALPPNQAPNPSQVTHTPTLQPWRQHSCLRPEGPTQKTNSNSPCLFFCPHSFFYLSPLFFFLWSLLIPLYPAPYVKVYLLDNGTCKAKKKTKIARKTLEPLYQQHLLFEESPQGKVLQVILWVFLGAK